MTNSISNKQMAGLIFEAMNSRDFAKVENTLAEDVIFDFPGAGQIEGKKRVLIFLKALLRKYTRLEFNITEVITEEDRLCVVWKNQGEDTDGKPYSNSGITLVHIKNEHIIFLSDYFKDTSFVS